MDGRALTASSFFTPIDLLRPRRRAVRNLCFNGRPSKFSVLSSKEEAELDRWDQMELKFGRLIGEDPKLTLAKVSCVSFVSVEWFLDSKLNHK